MPIKMTFDQLPAGIALTCALPEEDVIVCRTVYLSSEDGNHFVAHLESIWNQYRSTLDQRSIKASQVDHFLAVISPNKDAHLFCNELQLVTQMRVKANGELQDLKRFADWRDKQFWKKRATDEATGGSPPLKHLYQNVFAMTLVGACLLCKLEASGYTVTLDSLPTPGSRTAFETYPSSVAKRIGFTASYKSDSMRCMDRAISYLTEHGITLDLDPDVQRFCEIYRTGTKRDDPDGADAFLCLVAAIPER